MVALLTLSLVDVVVLLGIAVVLPLALGGPTRWWLVAAAAAGISFLLPAGAAVIPAVPFLVVAGGVALTPLGAVGAGAVRAGERVAGERTLVVRVPGLQALGGAVAAAYAVVSAAVLLQSRAGLSVLGVHEPIVELTAVHFTFAGSAALVLALAAHRDRGGRAAALAVGLTATAPPIVASGFVTGTVPPQLVGAVVMTLGVWLTAGLQLRTVVDEGWRMRARAGRPRAARGPGRSRTGTVLLGVSGLSVWAPMVLALAWAAALMWDVPALSITDMGRTHGAANAVGFCLCGLLGRRLQGPTLPVAGPPRWYGGDQGASGRGTPAIAGAGRSGERRPLGAPPVGPAPGRAT